MIFANVQTAASRSKGFTLIEIVVAICIVSILAGFGFNLFYGSQPNLKLSGAARDMLTDLRYTQQMAISQQINCGIRFDDTENKYQIIRFSQPEETVKTVYLPAGIGYDSISFSNSQVKFNIYGAATEAGSVILDNLTETTEINVKPSGFVKIIK